MRIRVSVMFMLAAISAVSTAADAPLYRWTDAQGGVHYGDQPAPNAKAVTAKPLSSAAPNSASAPSPVKPRAEVVPEVCQRKRDQLVSYRSAARITETNGLGETREYSEAERQKLIDAAEQAVKAACDPG